MLSLALALTFAAAPCPHPSPQQSVWFEDFDQPGTTVASTLFPNVFLISGGAFVREALDTTLGAPDTTPALPINGGGDKECRYFEPSAPSAGGQAFTDMLFSDVVIEGYFGIGYPIALGSRTASFAVRGGLTPYESAYVADFVHNGGTTARLHISLECNSLIVPSTVLASSDPFVIDPFTENYRLAFRAQGASLQAELWRVRAGNGAVVEEPIDLFATPGVQNWLTATDGRLIHGSVGVSAFARGASSVFFDDIQVTQLGAGPGLAYCFGDGIGAACPCNNSTRSGEGCRNSNGVGARLAAQGTTSVASNDLRLGASQVPRSVPAIFFAGTTANSIPFGAGVRCVQLPVARFPLQISGSCGELVRESVASYLGAKPGETWYFQAWFRDALGPCSSATNLTNALEVGFSP